MLTHLELCGGIGGFSQAISQPQAAISLAFIKFLEQSELWTKN